VQGRIDPLIPNGPTSHSNPKNDPACSYNLIGGGRLMLGKKLESTASWTQTGVQLLAAPPPLPGVGGPCPKKEPYPLLNKGVAKRKVAANQHRLFAYGVRTCVQKLLWLSSFVGCIKKFCYSDFLHLFRTASFFFVVREFGNAYALVPALLWSKRNGANRRATVRFEIRLTGGGQGIWG